MKSPCETCSRYDGNDCKYHGTYRACDRWRMWFRMKWREIRRMWRR